MRQPIILVGFTSCGKSATGRALARLSGFDFIDLDIVIENRYFSQHGIPLRCREIFTQKGADVFLSLEHEALAGLAGQGKYILSTGGGAPMDLENRRLIKLLGIVVHLDPDPSVIVDRLKNKGYPAYLGPDPTPEKLRQFWEIRNPVYAECADFSIDNTLISPGETAEKIVAFLKKRGV